jgi:stage II sporulation protein AB (anti-sigma F factor)
MQTANKVVLAPKNYMRLQFASKSENESFARVAIAAFVAQLDPTVEELTELKTAVSEAVTNAIIHGYENEPGEVRMECSIENGVVEVIIEDDGKGIENIELAREPMYTSKPELERSGMGITIMENFVDELEIESQPGLGTRVRMRKTIMSASEWQ